MKRGHHLAEAKSRIPKSQIPLATPRRPEFQPKKTKVRKFRLFVCLFVCLDGTQGESDPGRFSVIKFLVIANYIAIKIIGKLQVTSLQLVEVCSEFFPSKTDPLRSRDYLRNLPG